MRHKIDSSGLDIDRRRAERDFDDNPPAFEPAQGSSEGWDMDFDDLGSLINNRKLPLKIKRDKNNSDKN